MPSSSGFICKLENWSCSNCKTVLTVPAVKICMLYVPLRSTWCFAFDKIYFKHWTFCLWLVNFNHGKYCWYYLNNLNYLFQKFQKAEWDRCKDRITMSQMYRYKWYNYIYFIKRSLWLLCRDYRDLLSLDANLQLKGCHEKLAHNPKNPFARISLFGMVVCNQTVTAYAVIHCSLWISLGIPSSCNYGLIFEKVQIFHLKVHCSYNKRQPVCTENHEPC